jgi:hypothetical protein
LSQNKNITKKEKKKKKKIIIHDMVGQQSYSTKQKKKIKPIVFNCVSKVPSIPSCLVQGALQWSSPCPCKQDIQKNIMNII